MRDLATHASNLYPHEKIIILEGLLKTAIPIAKRLEEEDAEVFISRGGTAMALRIAGLQTPVVEIPITGKDMTQALEKAREKTGKKCPRIGVIAFPNMMQHLIDFLPVLNLDVRCRKITSEEETEKTIKALLEEGVDILLGGVITVRVADQLSVPAVLLESGESSFIQALEEALRIAYARRLENRRVQELKAILEYAYEGIVAVNEKGIITLFNPAAQKLFGISEQKAINRHAKDIIPVLKLETILYGGGACSSSSIVHQGNQRVMVNKVPILVHGRTMGAIATFQEVSKIQSLEEQIRRELHVKGHTAKSHFQDIIAYSRVLKETIIMAGKYARTNLSILIQGETGVGKELFAQSIHNASDRSRGPFVAINCAAIPENLLESELFGYVEGAFTGAHRKGKPGLFEIAHRGTIFLDEVSEMPYSLQARLLRVIQEREVMRLGSDRILPIDVRIICATNRDLCSMVDKGVFRSDLYWRLNVLSLIIPPLRERREDILPLIHYFLASSELCGGREWGFKEDAKRFLQEYPWPGNVRELKNFCDRVAAICTTDLIGLPELLKYLEPVAFPIPVTRERKVSKSDILKALKESGGSITKAAQRIGVHRTTIWRKLH